MPEITELVLIMRNFRNHPNKILLSREVAQLSLAAKLIRTQFSKKKYLAIPVISIFNNPFKICLSTKSRTSNLTLTLIDPHKLKTKIAYL